MRLDGVGKRYGLRGPWVVRDVGVELPEGALIRAVGGNGSGKSTLLRIVVGASLPTRGRVVDAPERRAYVPERFAAELPFTARGYLEHLGRLHGLRGPEPARRASELLERLGAGGLADRPVEELSKGSCQKVAVAQAFLGNPGLLVLDEAWTGLDQAARATLDTLVEERSAAGTTVVFVDHDPVRLAGRADTHWTFTDGRVVDERLGRTRQRQIRITARGRAAGAKGLTELPGVQEAREREDGHGGGADGGIVVTVDQDASDDVLRSLLGEPGVHVEEVRPV